MALTIDNVRLPSDIETGAEIGPQFKTSIIELTSGFEQRNMDWAQERLSANISYGMMYDENDNLRPEGEIERGFKEVLAFYRARWGMTRGFLFRDWSDYKAERALIGTTNGVNRAFQLQLIYDTYARKITRPVTGTIKIYVDGDEVPFSMGALGAGTINTGDVPATGLEITADFEFDVPVRFNTDVMQVTMAWARAGEIRDIQIIGLIDK